jgi:hypothetical protein
MATADRLEREAQQRNPWPYIDKAIADERAKQPINLQPGEDFRGDALQDRRDLDVADSKRQLNAAAMRADERQTEQAAAGQDFYAYYADQNDYSPGQQFLEMSAAISERESKLKTVRDIRDFEFIAQALEGAKASGAKINVDDLNNAVDWNKVNLAADKISRLMLDDPEKNRLAIENVYKTLEADNPMLAGLVPDVVTEKIGALAQDPSVVDNFVAGALQAIDTILTPLIVANEAVMQSVRAGSLQAQEAAQAGNGQLGVMGAFLGGTVTRRGDVEEGDFNEDYIQSIRDAQGENGDPLYSQLEVDIAVALAKLKATDPTASPWEILVQFATNNEAKAILGSMVSGVGPRAAQHAELLRQVDSAHLGNTGQMLFGAGVDEAYSEARGGETRQDIANIAGFTTSVVLDPTIVGTKVYRGVQGARYMLANLAPTAAGTTGARSILTKGKGFGPFRLNNKTYRFFDQLAKDLNRYEEAVKKADDLPAGDAQVAARSQADAMRMRIERQYGQIPDSTISDIFATVPRNADGKITVDTIADYIDETNSNYLLSYSVLEDEALKQGYALSEIPRFVAYVLDEQGIKSFDQMIAGGARLKRGDLTPQMTSLGVVRKAIANRISAEVMPKKKALKILEDYVDTTNAGTVAQSMSDNALEIGREAQKFKRGDSEGFFDSTRRMFSSIAIDNVIDLTDPDSARTVYRYARAFLPQKVSETVANAWRGGDTGSRRLLLSAVVRAAATSRGLTVTRKQADAWMGRVEDLLDMTGRKSNEAYGQQVTASTVPSRRLASQQYRGVQAQGVGGVDDARIPGTGPELDVPEQSIGQAQTGVPFRGDLLRGEGGVGARGGSLRGTGDESIAGPGIYLTDDAEMASDFSRDYSVPREQVDDEIPIVGEVVSQEVTLYNPFVIRGQDEWNAFANELGIPGKPGPNDISDVQAKIRGYLTNKGHDGMIVDLADTFRGSGTSISDTFIGNTVVKLVGDDVPFTGPSRPLDAVAPVVDRTPTVKTRSEKQDELFGRLGGTEDDLIEGRISWEEASRVEAELLDEYRGQILDNPELLDDFIDNYLSLGRGATDDVTDWWLEPVPNQPIRNAPQMPDEVGASRSTTARLQSDGTISRQVLADIADEYGDEGALSWLYTGYVDNSLDDSLGIPTPTPRLKDDFGNVLPGWRGVPEDWYTGLEVVMQRTGRKGRKRKGETRIAVPWAKGGTKGRKDQIVDEVDDQYNMFRDNLENEMRAGYYDRQIEEYITANREMSRDVRWEAVPAREPVFNPEVIEPEPVPFRTTQEANEPVSLSADARGIESALHLDQTSRFVRVPNLAEMEELRLDMGPLGKAMFASHRGVEWYTNMWSVWTLFGWRFSIRNAIEELGMWFLTAGSVSALAKGRVTSTARRKFSPDLYWKEIKVGPRKGEIKPVWKQTLGPVNRAIEKSRRGVARVAGRPQGDTLASWQAEWAEAKGMPGYFMRNIFLPVVAPRVNVEAMEQALLKYAQGNPEEWSKLVMEALVGYRLGGRSLASMGLISEDDLQIIGHLLNSSHALGLMDEVLQGGTFLNSARNPSTRGLANSLDGLDELPAGVLLGTVDEERALAAMKALGDKVGVKIDGFKMDSISTRRKLDDWHHLLRAVGQGDGVIGEEAIKGLFDISYGRATTAQVKARIAQAIRNDDSGDYLARFSRLSDEAGIDQFSSDYFEDVLAMFQRADGSLNTRLIDRFFDKQGNYLGWGRPTATLDDGIVYEDRITVADLAAIPTKERPEQLLLPNRSDREYIPFAGSMPGIIDRAYAWMGRQNARLSREPVFLGNVLTLWKASQARREQISRALASTRGKSYDDLAPETRKYMDDAAGALVSKQIFDDAYELSLAFMDNPANRSNLAWKARNISRYYRASEDFYRRMRRMAVSNPEGYAKAALAYSLIDDTGLVFTDDYGDKYFSYPLNGVAQQTVQLALRKVFRMDAAPQFFDAQPFTIGGKLLGSTPSADPVNFFAPPLTAGWGQIPATMTFSAIPKFAGARSLVLGQYNQPTGNFLGDFLNSFLPAGARRISAIQDPELIEGQIGDSTVKAVQIMSGWGLFDEVTIRDRKTGIVTKIPLDQATEAQVQASEEMRAADVFGTGLYWTKLVSSFMLPAFPQIYQNNVTDFARSMNTDGMSDAYYDYMDLVAYDEEYVKLLEDAIGKEIADPWNYAMAEWWLMKVNKVIDGDDIADGGSFLPFTVGSYEDRDDPNVQRANVRATSETLDWFNSDEGYQRYPQDLQGAALFLAPREGEWDANGHYVIKNLLNTRVKKSDDDKLRDIMNVEVSAALGRVKFRYDAQRNKLDPYSPTYADELRQVNASEAQERKEIKEENPRSEFAVFDIDRGTAVEAAENVRRLIAWEREQSPDGEISNPDVQLFSQALNIYDDTEMALKQYPRQTNRDKFVRNEIKANRDAEYRRLMEINPKIKNFIESVVIPMGE